MHILLRVCYLPIYHQPPAPSHIAIPSKVVRTTLKQEAVQQLKMNHKAMTENTGDNTVFVPRLIANLAKEKMLVEPPTAVSTCSTFCLQRNCPHENKMTLYFRLFEKCQGLC